MCYFAIITRDRYIEAFLHNYFTISKRIEHFHMTSPVAILEFKNNEAAAMFVFQENPLGVEFFSHVNAFFFSNKLE